MWNVFVGTRLIGPIGGQTSGQARKNAMQAYNLREGQITIKPRV